MKLFIIRHGQTAWNASKVFRGRKDIPLSDVGRRQAELAAERLADQGIRRIISSPLARARQTAEPLAARLALAVEPDDRLIDISYGTWEGQGDEQIRASFPDLHVRWTTHPDTIRFPGGETLAEVASRAVPAIRDYAAAGLDVALFTHRVVAKVLLLCLSGRGVEEFWGEPVSTGGISLYESGVADGRLRYKNETAHLASLGLIEADF